MQSKLEKLLTDYNTQIVSKNTADDQKFLIFSIERQPLVADSRLVGGLADRLKGLVSCFYAAVITGRRFVIHWETPIGLRENFAPHRYDWTYKNARKFVSAHHIARHIDLIDGSEVLDDLHPPLIEETLFKDEPVVIMNVNSYRMNSIRSWLEEEFDEKLSYNLIFTRAFQFLFNFIPAEEFQSNRDRFEATRAASDKLYGVHLRTGSGNGWRDPVLDDWQNYPAVLERAFAEAKAAGAKSPAFYFISDSVDARNAVANSDWPHPVIVDVENPAHLDRSTDFDRFSHDLTFHEFQCLSETDFIVCGKGGFASLAAMAGGKGLIRYNS